MLTYMQQRDPRETTKSACCRPCRAALRGPPIQCMPPGGGGGGGLELRSHYVGADPVENRAEGK